jgi:hypothetical protein
MERKLNALCETKCIVIVQALVLRKFFCMYIRHIDLDLKLVLGHLLVQSMTYLVKDPL